MKRNIINQQDFNGDVTFFDNRYCYTSGNPHYKRVTMVPKSNEIVATRLMDYKSPDRTNYMHLIRNNTDDDCYFDVELSIMDIAHPGDFKHRYLKMEGDFKADKLQDIQFLVSDDKTGENVISAELNITADGAVTGGTETCKNMVMPGEWFHILWALNLENGKYDVYVGGKKVLSDIRINSEMKQFNTFRLNLTGFSEAGDLYIDNFNVTGLIKPIVDGVETKTRVIADEDAIIQFLSDKVGMHAYGNTLCKNGVKTALKTNGIYDNVTGQYYVTADTLNKAFDLNLKDMGEETAGDIAIKSDGTVTFGEGKCLRLDFPPQIKNGKIYIPVRQFASDVLGKYVWWFKTGIIIFSDYEIALDDKSWVWQSERDNSSASGCTRWNDIDHLNGFLQYIRPSADMLMDDYIRKTGDVNFTQHPRIYLTADDFADMKERYCLNKDVVFSRKVKEYIAEADEYLSKPFADYTMWSDAMRHMGGREATNRFMAWGFAYHMTGDKKYVDAAFKQFEIAATFPDFNTSHIIDTGETAAGLAIGYDWFYNAFTPEQRKLAVKVLREDCLDVLASGMYGRLTSCSDGAAEWRSFRLMSNYNAINNCGITLAAIATIEYDPESSFRYISDSARSVEYTMQMFPPVGAWTEGPQYLSYTLRFLVPWALNMEKNFGTSYNLMDGQGMSGIVDFMIACNGKQGTNNMGDGNWTPRRSYESYFYFAKRFNKPYASYMRWHDLECGNSVPSFYDLMYWDFSAGEIENESLDTVPKMQCISGMELFSIRDSYADDADFYFSAHFGTTSGYHQHWDCGTFVLELLDRRWAFDLGSDNYILQNELGYKGYEIFRKRCEAHNMLVINPGKYTEGVEINLGEFAPVIDAQANSNSGFVYADMSRVYEASPHMTLGYYVGDSISSVTMRNEFVLKESQPCMWTMMTQGDISIDGNTAYIKQDDGTLKLEFICSDENAVWKDEGNPHPLAETIPADKFSNQKQNEEYKQLRLWFDGLAGDNKIIVKIGPADRPAKPIEDIPFSEWKLV